MFIIDSAALPQKFDAGFSRMDTTGFSRIDPTGFSRIDPTGFSRVEFQLQS